MAMPNSTGCREVRFYPPQKETEQEYVCMALVIVLLVTMQLHLSVSHSALLAPSALIGPELQRKTLSGRGHQTTLPARGRN